MANCFDAKFEAEARAEFRCARLRWRNRVQAVFEYWVCFFGCQVTEGQMEAQKEEMRPALLSGCFKNTVNTLLAAMAIEKAYQQLIQSMYSKCVWTLQVWYSHNLHVHRFSYRASFSLCASCSCNRRSLKEDVKSSRKAEVQILRVCFRCHRPKLGSDLRIFLLFHLYPNFARK